MKYFFSVLFSIALVVPAFADDQEPRDCEDTIYRYCEMGSSSASSTRCISSTGSANLYVVKAFIATVDGRVLRESQLAKHLCSDEATDLINTHRACY